MAELNRAVEEQELAQATADVDADLEADAEVDTKAAVDTGTNGEFAAGLMK